MFSFSSRTTAIVAIFGCVLLALLLLAGDPLLTWEHLADAGWAVILVSLYRAVPLAFDAAGWRVLFDAANKPGPARVFIVRWIGESINALLPTAQVGGDVVRAQLIAKRAPDGLAAAGAATMADFTLGLVAQVLFTVAGAITLTVAVAPENFPVSSVALVFAVVVFSLLIFGFFLWQRRGGPARAGRVLARTSSFNLIALEDFDRRLRDVYGRRKATAGCVAWRLAGWLACTGETGIVLWFLGLPVEFGHLVAIESLSYAVRSAAFIVPGALGVQEAGLLGLGVLLGLSPEEALALAVIKRAREAIVGLPGLAIWLLPRTRR